MEVEGMFPQLQAQESTSSSSFETFQARFVKICIDFAQPNPET